MESDNNEPNIPQSLKSSIFSVLVNYLTNTRPVNLFIHLLYIMGVCAALSFSYIVSFHWGSIVEIYSNAHDVRAFGQNIKVTVEKDKEINDILEHLRIKTNGARAYVYRYHNGLAAINGVSFFFQTNTHEVISAGATRLLPYEQRIPASINPGINTHFVQNECAIILNTHVDKNSQFYYLYQLRTAKAVIRCPIYMDHGDLFGFVGVDYLENPENPKKDAIDIEEATENISNIFESVKK